jgi:2-phosphosulfolactate phosphatase
MVEVGGRDTAGASPEARAAMAAFDAARDDLDGCLAGSVSGRELVARGWSDDVAAAAALDAEAVAPVLDGSEFAGVTPATAVHLR